MGESANIAARVRPLPPKNISLSAKARPLKANSNYVPPSEEEQDGQPLLPNQAFEAAFLWKATNAAKKTRTCAQPDCSKLARVLHGAQGGMESVFCDRCEVIDTSCARDRPLPRCGRRQTRASSRPPRHQVTVRDADGTNDEETPESVHPRDGFCGDLGNQTVLLAAESFRRQSAADAEHAKIAARLAAAGRCAQPGCTEPQAFGLESSKKAEFCRSHKKEGMVNLCNLTRCRHRRCTKPPTFGVPGTRIVEFCGYHRKEGMVNETAGKCSYSGCVEAASHGSRKHAEVCSQHARAGMVNVASGRPKRRTGRDNGTELQCALTGASSNGGAKRARRVDILQRASPIQPPTVKREIDDSCPSSSNPCKVVQRARESMILRRNSYTYMGGW